jgi:antitoxin component of MazEF toxin-antitoxin module
MPAETLTYAAIADRLGFSSEAARALVNWLWPWRQGVGKVVVAVDLAERQTVSAHSSNDQSVVTPLRARIETLEAELAKVEAASAVHRADFERERERCERLMAEMLKATADLMAAREAAARLAGELEAVKARPWWRRLVG